MARKGSRKTRTYRREGKNLPLRDTVLIVCQGKETEKNYFSSLKDDFGIRDLKVEVKSKDPHRIVDYALKKSCLKKSRYNRIWCVLDKDNSTDQNFNDAVTTAGNREIGVAYSNKSFELWLYLHFHYSESAQSSQEYEDKLKGLFKKHFDKTYEKNDKEIFSLLRDKMERAIRHAEKLYSKRNKDSPAKADPSTTVHRLIKELQKKAELSEL
ncbi:MAG: RloB family protein [Candidatus Eremiobacteraeota bacterium]|nr:RloB family protein [Candidatus Eremiobacteraeota bacterium]